MIWIVPYQSKLKGMLSGPKFDENTFLNSSKVIVPEESLGQELLF